MTDVTGLFIQIVGAEYFFQQTFNNGCLGVVGVNQDSERLGMFVCAGHNVQIFQVKSASFNYLDFIMRLLIALLLPWLTFFTIGRPFAGIICLILQITLIGWVPAAIWAVYALSQFKTDKKIAKALGDRN